jgi:ABC-type Fe3+ transport system permease subunit
MATKRPARTTRTRQSKQSPAATTFERTERTDRIDWHSLYIYAICLVTILILLFALVSVVRSLVDAAWPDAGYFDPYSVPKESTLSADQIKENLTNQNRRQSIKSLINSITTLVIAGPIYLYHWKLAKKSRATLSA